MERPKYELFRALIAIPLITISRYRQSRIEAILSNRLHHTALNVMDKNLDPCLIGSNVREVVVLTAPDTSGNKPEIFSSVEENCIEMAPCTDVTSKDVHRFVKLL